MKDDQRKCVICFEEEGELYSYRDNFVECDCKSTLFHKDCWNRFSLTQQSCPTCRSERKREVWVDIPFQGSELTIRQAISRFKDIMESSPRGICFTIVSYFHNALYVLLLLFMSGFLHLFSGTDIFLFILPIFVLTVLDLFSSILDTFYRFPFVVYSFVSYVDRLYLTFLYYMYMVGRVVFCILFIRIEEKSEDSYMETHIVLGLSSLLFVTSNLGFVTVFISYKMYTWIHRFIQTTL